MEKNYFETTGTIIKEERIGNVEYKISPNTLVLEIIEPFPGYHHQVPEFKKPESIFLMTRSAMSREIIARLTKKIRSYFPHPFDAASAIIEAKSVMHGIRIKNLPSFELIEEIQNCFRAEGIEFRKYRKIDESAIITVKKFFEMYVAGDNLFVDKEENMAYIAIPEPLSWNKFKEMTISIRNNWDFKDFDAAMGSMYYHGELWELIRIFWEKTDIEKLRTLKQKYFNEILRY